MALMLGVSKRTVENRFAEFNMTRIERYSDIDDSSLDVYTKHIITLFPRSGTALNSIFFWEYHMVLLLFCILFCLTNSMFFIFSRKKVGTITMYQSVVVTSFLFI